jgi:hypothetical protein
MQQALHAIGFLALAHALQQFFKLTFRQPLKRANNCLYWACSMRLLLEKIDEK